MTSGDGWTRCDAGHRHWGLFGAAGLLIADRDRVILQHRAPWTHQGDTWGVPGGARDSHETAVQTALREAAEEGGIAAADVAPVGLYVDDHGGWSYTTVVATAERPIAPAAANAESVEVRWVDRPVVATLPLHAGFAASWPHLAELPETLHLIVADELFGDPVIQTIARLGITVDRLPTGARSAGMTSLIPVVHRVTDASSAARLAAERVVGEQTLIVLDAADLALLVEADNSNL